MPQNLLDMIARWFLAVTAGCGGGDHEASFEPWSGIKPSGTSESEVACRLAADGAGSVTVDPSLCVFAEGSSQGDLGGNPNAGKTDVFVIKYDGPGHAQ